MVETRGGIRSETDTSESVYESDAEDGQYRREENDIGVWLTYYIDMWKCYWKKRFFRQLVRSSIVFIIGLKLLREIKGLDILPASFPEVPDEPPC
ncbi:hypothetical protein RUM43_005541 [Polyplax serrata]|uniref:Uncharacterized protein n=1 Tax=Polyplax serrata TaxID=468196 RepID=A0AAN8NQD3_POLSC